MSIKNEMVQQLKAPLLAPSVLSADFSRLKEQLDAIKEGGADWVHLDVMDGHFVPNLTFGPFIVSSITKCCDLEPDAHLMVENPERYIEAFAKAGVKRLTVHAEATHHLDRLVEQIRSAGMKPGVSLNPATSLAVLDYILPSVDLVLIMSVNPGFGGQSFIPYSMDKIRNLRKLIEQKGLSTLIQVDGGAGLDNAADLVAAGVDCIVAGSAVLGQKDIALAAKNMKQCMQEGWLKR